MDDNEQAVLSGCQGKEKRRARSGEDPSGSRDRLSGLVQRLRRDGAIAVGTMPQLDRRQRAQPLHRMKPGVLVIAGLSGSHWSFPQCRHPVAATLFSDASRPGTSRIHAATEQNPCQSGKNQRARPLPLALQEDTLSRRQRSRTSWSCIMWPKRDMKSMWRANSPKYKGLRLVPNCTTDRCRCATLAPRASGVA